MEGAPVTHCEPYVLLEHAWMVLQIRVTRLLDLLDEVCVIKGAEQLPTQAKHFAVDGVARSAAAKQPTFKIGQPQ